MAHPSFRLWRLVLRLVLGVAAGVSLLLVVMLAHAAQRTGASPVYSAAILRAHLEQHPEAWMGRTVMVRAMVEPCPWWGMSARLRHCADQPLVLMGAPTDAPADPLPLVWPASPPLLALLRRLPVLGALLPAPEALQWGAVATYRVRLWAGVDDGCGIGACFEAVLLDAASWHMAQKWRARVL